MSIPSGRKHWVFSISPDLAEGIRNLEPELRRGDIVIIGELIEYVEFVSLNERGV